MLLAAATSLAAQTAFEAALERAEIAMGDTVSLRLRAIGDLSGEPDLSPLTKDFEIVDRTTWSSFNSASRNLREWLLVLAPRRSGRISISGAEPRRCQRFAARVDGLGRAQAGRHGG